MSNDDVLAAMSVRHSSRRAPRGDTHPTAHQGTTRLRGRPRHDGAPMRPPEMVRGPVGSQLSRRLRHRQVLADGAAIAVGLALVTLVSGSRRPDLSAIGLLAMLVVTGIVWLSAMGAHKLYVTRYIERPVDEFRRLLEVGVVGAGSMIATSFIVQTELLSRLWVVGVFLAVTAMLLVERRISRRMFAALRASGRLNRRVGIIGTDAHAIALLHTVQRNPSLGYEVVGFIGEADLGQRGGRTLLGGLDQAVEILREHQCVGAMISLSSVDAVQVNRLTRMLTDADLHVALSTSLRDIDVCRIRPQGLDGQALIYVEPTIRTGWRSHAKRAFDVVIATLALLFALPMLAVAAILIKLESKGPVLFRQTRVGKDGKPFAMIKLRTMHRDAEQRKADLMALNEFDGPMFKIKDDPRITRVGRVLRRLSIDEFPQFWNVLCGEMSVVGPRPALPAEVIEWDRDLHDRLRVLPGITGMWQVSGRSDTTFEEYKRLDLYYVDNWSLLHDLRIVVKTFGVVVIGRGAS